MLGATVSVLLAVHAGAQSTSAPIAPPAAPPLDSPPPFERPNGALLRPGTLTYALSLVRPGGDTVGLGIRTVVVSDAALGGNAGSLITETRTGTVVPTWDSVFVVRADLSPERWSASIGSAQLGASFTRDSVFGGVQNYQGRASFALAIPANILLSAGMLERVIELLPLREGYRAGAALLLVDGLTPRVVPAEVVVENSERVSIASRAIDAWRVVLRWDGMEERLWIARDGARVVKTEQVSALGVLISAMQ